MSLLGITFSPLASKTDINRFRDIILDRIKKCDIKLDYPHTIKLIYDSLPKLVHNNIIVKPSSLHGNGVFATCDIPKNVVVTFYPAHAVHIDGTASVFRTESTSFQDFASDHDKYARDYSAYFRVERNNFIVGNPHEISNPMHLGHIINDPVGNIFNDVSFDKTKNYKIFMNLMKDYFVKGFKMQNCKLVPDEKNLMIYVKTTKNIKEGEELFVCYEPLYWFNYTYGTNNTDDNHGFILFNRIVMDPNFINFILKLNQVFS